MIPSFTQLTRLVLLNASGPGLSAGFERLAALPGLQQLAMVSCGLAEVPPAMSALSALTGLNLRDNYGLVRCSGDQWQPILRLPRLRELSLPHPEVSKLPPELTAVHRQGPLILHFG